jgi:hypothetical protein
MDMDMERALVSFSLARYLNVASRGVDSGLTVNGCIM